MQGWKFQYFQLQRGCGWRRIQRNHACNPLAAASGLSVAVIDKGPVPARGLAYCTDYHCHLLNVPASRISPFPEEPDHFLRWAEANPDPSVQPEAFYLVLFMDAIWGHCWKKPRDAMAAAIFAGSREKLCSVGRERSQIDVHLKDGSKLVAEALVLAAGNFPPANLRLPGFSGNGERYVRSPWAQER